MALVNLHNLNFGFGGPFLLEDVNLHIHAGDRVCLVGRNGVGKTTLMRLITGEIAPAGGEIVRQPGVTVSRLAQEASSALRGDAYDICAGGLGSIGEQLAEYHHVTRALDGAASAESSEPADDHAEQHALLARLETLQHELEAAGGWNLHQRIEAALTRLRLDKLPPFEQLSAGLKRQVLLARALVSEPDLLLLDEPTNHLDIAAIGRLEEFLQKYEKTVVFVTHDRAFLQAVATRIVEIDRGRVRNWDCDYKTFLERRDALLIAEESRLAEFNKKLVQEEAWIREGVKERRVRNQGRVRRLMEMRAENRARRKQVGLAKMSIQQAQQSGNLIFRAEDVSFGYGDRPLIRDFSTWIMRGDRVGILGPNGGGKSTLLRLLLGELAPQAGTLRRGTNLEVVYFDQHQVQLDESKSVKDNVCIGSDTFDLDGRRQHVLGYLQRFLFTPQRARSPVSQLSGGERNRLLLARLFTKPSNLMVLDEPTNDLDAETLELLEEMLFNYAGTVLVVSHDRAFLNNVVTSTLAIEGDGYVREYAGGYDDYLLQRKPPIASPEEIKASVDKKARAEAQHETRVRPAGPRRMSFKEKQELAALPDRIEALESEQKSLHDQMADPEFFKDNGRRSAAATARLGELATALNVAYARWEELEQVRIESDR